MSNYPSVTPSNVLNISSFSGLNLETHSSRIADNEAAEMENFTITENGVLSKRRGILSVFGLGDTDKVLNMIEFNGNLIVGTINYIYIVSSTEKSQVIYTYTTNPSFMEMFIMDSKLYILDGISFKEYDGITVKEVISKAYAPTLFITCTKFGVGIPLEDWNLIGDKFKMSYSADGTSKEYSLCFPDCEVTEVILNYVVTTAYTVQPDINGNTMVRFTTAPVVGTDNIIITAKIKQSSKMYTEKLLPNIERINKCSVYSFYGGENDTRLLLSGQDSVFYRSGVYNPYYFPENHYQSVGDTDEKIMGFVTQYDYCVILKEKSIWYTRVELLDSGISAYTTKPLNSQYGCNNSKTIQLINNAPIFLSKKGIAVINQTQVRDERNVEIISNKINTELMKEDLTKAVTIDYDNKYILAVGNKLYIYDYLYNCFYTWKINHELFDITCFTLLNGVLYIGTDLGHVYKYRTSSELQNSLSGAAAYQDEFKIGDTITPITINSIWKSKLFNFEEPNKTKMIESLFATISPSESTSADISYITDKNSEMVVGTISNNLFAYDKFNYSKMSYLSSFHPVVDSMKVKLKKIVYFQLLIKNNSDDENLDIYNLGIKFKTQKEVK